MSQHEIEIADKKGAVNRLDAEVPDEEPHFDTNAIPLKGQGGKGGPKGSQKGKGKGKDGKGNNEFEGTINWKMDENGVWQFACKCHHCSEQGHRFFERPRQKPVRFASEKSVSKPTGSVPSAKKRVRANTNSPEARKDQRSWISRSSHLRIETRKVKEGEIDAVDCCTGRFDSLVMIKARMQKVSCHGLFPSIRRHMSMSRFHLTI